MSIDETTCAVCHGPLARGHIYRIERYGADTCPVCSLVIAVCAKCYRERSEEAAALDERFKEHLWDCEQLEDYDD